jgi:hypothetical protein
MGSRYALEPDLIQHWWSLASSKCLPVILNEELSSSGNLIQGESCLFVNSSSSAWTAAAGLIRNSYPALLKIAGEARRKAYFGCSVQKNISYVAEILTLSTKMKYRFDKFLPL